MNILFMSPHGLTTVLKQYLTDISVYMQIPSDAVLKAQEGNHFFGFPRKQDIIFAAENILFAPKFYDECLQKIATQPGALGGLDLDELRENIPPIIEAMKKGLSVPVLNPDKSYESIKLLARARNLFEWIRKAHPGVAHLVNYLQSNLFEEHPRVSISSCLAGAQELWQTANLFYDNQLGELISSCKPDLVFCQAILPQALPFAVSTAVKLKSLCPEAKLMLINSEWSLTSTVGHYGKDLFTDELFEVFDGAIVYADLQPLTVCEVIQNISSGKNLHDVENVVCKHEGTLVFNEPKPATAARFFEKSSLHKFHDKVSPFAFENDQTEEILPGAAPIKSALIFPSQQACYWNRCKFCSINTQNFLLRDPHIAMRGDEAAHLLLTLKREGYHTAFLGREAVHPEILDRLVHQLQNKSDVLPWGFEGRFGSYLSTDFIQSLKNSGCCGTVFGLETPSDRLNTLMDKYDGNVNISFIERIIDDYRQVNMLVNVNTIANLPGTTPEEYVSHIQWLKNQFNKNPLFHFTANYFGLYEHSEIGKHPDKYGLELTSLAKSCGLHHELGLEQIMGYGWKPLSGKREPNLSLNAWQEIFHVDSRWGVNLGTLHILYHECYNISAVDMLLQTNCFKRLQAELEFLSHKSPLHFRIPEHVLVKPVTRKGKEGSLFFDRNTGTMEFVSNKVLQTIQSGENDSPPVRIKKPHSPAAEILEELFLEKFKQDQASHLKSILQLAASDLLSWD